MNLAWKTVLVPLTHGCIVIVTHENTNCKWAQQVWHLPRSLREGRVSRGHARVLFSPISCFICQTNPGITAPQSPSHPSYDVLLNQADFVQRKISFSWCHVSESPLRWQPRPAGEITSSVRLTRTGQTTCMVSIKLSENKSKASVPQTADDKNGKKKKKACFAVMTFFNPVF